MCSRFLHNPRMELYFATAGKDAMVWLPVGLCVVCLQIIWYPRWYDHLSKVLFHFSSGKCIKCSRAVGGCTNSLRYQQLQWRPQLPVLLLMRLRKELPSQRVVLRDIICPERFTFGKYCCYNVHDDDSFEFRHHRSEILEIRRIGITKISNSQNPKQNPSIVNLYRYATKLYYCD
jgi:hypothetical protein